MRLLEIKSLLEATTLTAKEMSKYPFRQEVFLQKVKNQSPFELDDGTSGVVDKKELPRLKQLFAAGNFAAVGKIKLADGRMVAMGKFKKTGEFGGKTGGEEGKVSNRGEVAEGIMGAGLFAKLAARAGGKINAIGPDDIWRVIDQLKSSGADEYSMKIRDAGKVVVNDSIVFTLRLKEGPYKDLLNPAKRSLLTDLVGSVVEFSNSKDAEEYSKYFYLNGKPDIINVIADGVTEEKSSKVDVKVVVTDPKTGQQSERVLNLSLKAGADQFGQVGGGKAAVAGSQFESQKTLWSRFGIDVESLRADFERLLKDKGLLEAIAMMYTNADSMFRELLSGDYDEEEYLYLKDFVKAINYFATLNMPNILLVSMEGGTYDVLNFDLLEGKLKDINLSSRFSETTKNPQVEIYDEATGQWLLRVRAKVEGGSYLRNYIEKGPLMSKLISVKR
jgi:hypothetical protein